MNKSVRLWSPFQILPELIEVDLSSSLTQAIRDVVHSCLLQPETHQGLVATLGGTGQRARIQLISLGKPGLW